MFQSLRANNIIYILHKGNKPYVETGTVVNVTPPMPKFNVPPQYGQPQEFVVDLTVRIGDQTVTYQKLPANVDIADFGNNTQIVLSTSKDAMNSEVASLKQKSVDIIASIDSHKEIISGCDEILQALNPEFADRQRNEKEMSEMKSQMAQMAQQMSNMMAMMSQLSAAETTKKVK